METCLSLVILLALGAMVIGENLQLSCGCVPHLCKDFVADLKGIIWWLVDLLIGGQHEGDLVCHIKFIRSLLCDSTPLQRRRIFYWEVNFGRTSPHHCVVIS